MSQNQNGKIDHFHRELPPQDDTDEEVYAVAEESVNILEESHKETSKVLKELQSDWASQGSDSIMVLVHTTEKLHCGSEDIIVTDLRFRIHFSISIFGVHDC